MQDPEIVGPERRLVERFQSGSKNESFEEIYRLYLPRVRAVCRRYLRDAGDVEEAVQDTFTKAYLNLIRFNGSFKLGSWFARIAINSSLDIVRRNQRRPPVVPLGDEEGMSQDHSLTLVGDTTPVSLVLDRLPAEHARILLMRAQEGASHEEIGAALGKTSSQAKAMLHRARISFKKMWREFGAASGFLLVALGAGMILSFHRLARSLPRVASQMQVVLDETLAFPMAAITSWFS